MTTPEELQAKYPAYNTSGLGTTTSTDPNDPFASFAAGQKPPKYIGLPDDITQADLGVTPAPDHYVFGMPNSALGPHTAYGTQANPIGLYTEKDVFAPNSDPRNLPILQMALVNAGFMDPKDVQKGVFNDAMQKAYRSALAFANGFGGTVSDALQIAAQSKTPEQRQAIAPRQLTNPAELRKAYRDTAESLIGKDLPASEDQQFAAMYQGQEKAAYRQLAGAYDSGEMFAGNAPASPTAAAEDYINTHHLADKIAYGAASRQAEFFGMLGSPVSTETAQGQ